MLLCLGTKALALRRSSPYPPRVIAPLAALLAAKAAFAAPQPAWQTRLAALQDEIAAAHAALPGDAAKRLHELAAQDQKIRYFWIDGQKDADAAGEHDAFMTAMNKAISDVDRYDTAQLKRLLEQYDWFAIDEFGAQADEDAWLLVQHADLEPAFQKEVLGRLGRLYASGRTSKHNYAFLYDRVAVAEKRPQRYGTQGDCKDGVWTPYPSEEPALLDDRRAAMGLESIAERPATLSPQYCR